MQIAIIALGSRGDVQPYIALGKGLKKAGHTVRLVTHQNFDILVKSYGLEFWNIRGNVQDVIESPEMRELLDKGNFLAITRRTAKEAERAALQWAEDGLVACDGTDLIITGIGSRFIGLALAEKLHLPVLQTYLVPFTPTKTFPSALVPPTLPKLGGMFNRITHHLAQQVMWQGSRSGDTLARKQVLGLPPASFFGPKPATSAQALPTLYGFSPSVIPPPPDWNNDQHVTGFWFLDSADEWTPPQKLMNFLQAGSPPIYIGFGSMTTRKPEETADLVIKALEHTNQRAILVSGWGGLQKTDLPESIFMIDSIPHAWLFPHVAAVVHHGGAGTTAAGLRAGVPSIVIPFFADQPYWGQRVADLGVGPIPIPRQKLTAERLAQAIQIALTDQAMRQRAVDLGSKIQVEDGVTRAVEIIQQVKKRLSI
jgi:sterol 3beta-glucosyltransferase